MFALHLVHVSAVLVALVNADTVMNVDTASNNDESESVMNVETVSSHESHQNVEADLLALWTEPSNNESDLNTDSSNHDLNNNSSHHNNRNHNRNDNNDNDNDHDTIAEVPGDAIAEVPNNPTRIQAILGTDFEARKNENVTSLELWHEKFGNRIQSLKNKLDGLDSNAPTVQTKLRVAEQTVIDLKRSVNSNTANREALCFEIGREFMYQQQLYTQLFHTANEEYLRNKNAKRRGKKQEKPVCWTKFLKSLSKVENEISVYGQTSIKDFIWYAKNRDEVLAKTLGAHPKSKTVKKWTSIILRTSKTYEVKQIILAPSKSCIYFVVDRCLE